MHYLVDGHNLIPKTGIRLDALDDEDALLSLLLEFCRKQRAVIEVFFDGAPAGHPGKRKTGAVTTHFARIGSSADGAIEGRLGTLGKQARNWTVVSSDARVQAAARAAHARTLTAEEFSAKLSSNDAGRQSTPERALKPDEVEEWMQIFKNGKK
jgi:predicted RNA-binding protein with PIN domain